jgi:hypothetical protein
LRNNFLFPVTSVQELKDKHRRDTSPDCRQRPDVRRGTGILPVGFWQAIGHGQEAHANCATVNRQMRPATGRSLSVHGRCLSGARERCSMPGWSAGRNVGRAASRRPSVRRFPACRTESRQVSPARSSCPITAARSSADPSAPRFAFRCVRRRRCAEPAGRTRWRR